ncbi:MarR family transcriptional regulator [Streptomyces sp. NBC_01077]|uniref:MarR family winged helix-turn-helix transcriptional regulator n=1 Tax=Streptomyces sp. NBC_01077 TaxID=2903746 RepID=UPI00386BACFF|nr:MarR family transcriptional regulator [Streptomyces sp. NBC_01077]
MSREQQDALSRTALGVFRLNGQFLAVSEKLAEPAGLTAAWWQVLGAVLQEPLPVAGIARVMGITRQSVQRIADLLVREGLAAYEPNPAHRRAKLLTPTEAGRAAIARIEPGHAHLAALLMRELGGQEAFDETVRVLDRLSAALEAAGTRYAAPEAAEPEGRQPGGQ